MMSITGARETAAALAELDAKVQKKLLRKGLRVGAKLVLEAARAAAPGRSGTLRRNIKIRGGRRPAKGNVSIGVGVAVRPKAPRNDAFYAFERTKEAAAMAAAEAIGALVVEQAAADLKG